MQIKRDFEMTSLSSRRFIIRQSPFESKLIVCAACGDAMLTIAQASVLLGIKQSQIFQIVEKGAAHSTEAEEGPLMICLKSLAGVLDCDS